MSHLTIEREQALRWLLANRRPEIPIEQAVRLLCTVLPRDLSTMQMLRRIADEEEAKQSPTSQFNTQSLPHLPPRG